MKKSGVINKDIGQLLYELGHTDEITLADIGLPIPPEVPRIDVSLSPGEPSFLKVLDVVLSDMHVQEVTLAKEIETENPDLLKSIQERLPEVAFHFISHEALKAQTMQSRGLIRTGEASPYANIILHAGNVF